MPWIKSCLKRALRAKSKAWCTFDEFPTISNLNLALFKNQNFENLKTKAKLRYEKVITNDLKHNSKAFYSYLRKVKSIVTTLRKDKNLGSMTTNDYETAECFADAFSSVFTREPLDPLPQCCYDTSKDSIVNLEIGISEKEIYNEFKSINIYKSFGPDNIHPKLLHALADNHDFVKCMKIL